MKLNRPTTRLASALAGATATAVVLAGTSGATHLGSLQLGHANTSTAQTSLTANLDTPVLKVVNQGAAAAVRGEAQSGIGTNGISIAGVGQQGLSQTGIGTLGTHGATSGINPGVQGETNSTDPGGAAVVGKNMGGGPGLRAIVNAGAPPLAVNSPVKVANLNADLLDGLDSLALQKRVSGSCAAGSAVKVVNADGSVACEPVGGGGVWSLTGNAGTTPGIHFLGTSDFRALVLKVDGSAALRLEPNGTPNLIGGDASNAVLTNSPGVTISGGGRADQPNVAWDAFNTIGGGLDNRAGTQFFTGEYATVAGGLSNIAGGSVSTVGGGQDNVASSYLSTVGGGYQNTASGGYATVPGGWSNTAGGDSSFAAGHRAKAMHQGSFVLADSNDFDFNSLANNVFAARATGGFKLVSGIDGTTGDATSFCILAAGSGTWDCVSDRNAKEHFARVDGEQTLRKLSRIPIETWNYKSQDHSIRHIGPMAQDFRAAFGLGLGPTTIAGVDADGVAFSAIQGLYRQNQALERQNRALANRLARLERAVVRLSR